MQIYLDEILRVVLIVRLMLEVHIQFGWKMDVGFATYGIGDGFLVSF